MNKKRLSDLEQALQRISERSKSGKAFDAGFALRVVNRLALLAKECDACKTALADLTKLVDELDATGQMLAREDVKPLQKQIDLAVAHLQKQHKLTVAGEHLALSLAFGLSLGVAFGITIFDNVGIGMALGVALGLAIGQSRDSKANKDGRVI